jgi:hypothetical protein
MTTSQLLMVRPAAFGYNPETAVNNAFQRPGDTNTQEKALREFDAFVSLLEKHDIDVMVMTDTIDPHTPDSIFPNNWLSTHADCTLCLYPMFAENRRLERRLAILDAINTNFVVEDVIDFTHYETENKFLEGTGSMTLDRDNLIAYACLSPRTDKEVLFDFCKSVGYAPCYFDAVDKNGRPIYHTNVMLSVCEYYVITCLESIPNAEQRNRFVETIEDTGKKIIPITFHQVEQFAGNMLEVKNVYNKHFLVMSDTAYRSLTADQIAQMESYDITLLHPELRTIENNGGGSARCMMAEIFLAEKK